MNLKIDLKFSTQCFIDKKGMESEERSYNFPPQLVQNLPSSVI